MRRAAVLAGALLLLAACGSSSAAARRTVRLPPAAGVFDYQLGGSYKPAADVRIVDRDSTSVPVRGVYSICYVNAFQTQPEAARYWTSKHPALLLKVGGRYVHDPDWPGEYILDTSTAAKRTQLLAIVGAWFDGCARKGFAAIEPDNLDSWTRQGVHGAITEADDLAFARLLVARAHADGLAVAQKNTVEISRTGHASIGFDFAVAEECEVYHECGGYISAYGKRVLEVEYTDNGTAAYARACKARHGTMSIILRDRDVTPRGDKAYVYKHC